jgi:Protein of unknown function (DUF1579)
MKILAILFVIVYAGTFATPPGALGQNTANPPSVATSPVAAPANPTQNGVAAPNEAEMMKQMMELSKLNENHKLLADTTGTWSYTVKMWMNPDPNAKAQESKGTATRKMTMNGRYLVGDYTGTMPMPGPDGKMKSVTFKGMGMEAYDNVKKKFVATWVDNMGTGIEMSEGTYDPSSKSFTYTAEVEPMPGMKSQVREVLKLADKDHMSLEWYENQGSGEKKTMEINYTRAGKAEGSSKR